MTNEYFAYRCPNCQVDMNAAHVAAALPDVIVLAEAARRNGRRQTPHPGPGRPVLARCPGCDAEMHTSELREHRVDCVRNRLKEIQGKNFWVHLHPKDPDPYPNFVIRDVGVEEVRFEKLSSTQEISIALQKVAEIAVTQGERLADIRLLGRVIWREDITCWRFVLTRPGRRACEA